MPVRQVIHGDARSLPLADRSVEAIVTDPPYELGFMGRRWDSTGVAYDVATWQEALRVLKPGGHLLAFGGTRTYHRLVCAIEDAGFEIRDSITWMYGSGFPKSLDVSKAIDKAAGAKRETVGPRQYADGHGHIEAWPGGPNGHEGWQCPGMPVGEDRLARGVTAPATEDAQRWAGYGTALKPATEPIVVARKPLSGTVAANVLGHGVGALNIDGCRVGMSDRDRAAARVPQPTLSSTANKAVTFGGGEGRNGQRFEPPGAGRWPANVVLSHAPLLDEHGVPAGDGCAEGCVAGCPVAELDEQSGVLTSGNGDRGATSRSGGIMGQAGARSRTTAYGRDADSGGASRFFPTFRYQAKAPTRERPRVDGAAHPTVKPLELMRWLVRLVTPPGGVVLDPFAGSGTTAEAAALEGFGYIVAELHEPYLALIRNRLDRVPA